MGEGRRVGASVAGTERSAIRDSCIPQNSGVREFCQYQLRKSETSDLRCFILATR
jgi:hypothetical protein